MTEQDAWYKDIRGELLRAIVRIKPATNFQREDLRINNQTIILTDPNNRILEEFEVPEAYGPETPLEHIYADRIAPMTTYFLRGININMFAYGSTGAGKSQTIEGNKREKGVVMLYAQTLFALLANKAVQSQLDDSPFSDYKYEVTMTYLEIIDEVIVDLLGERKAGLILEVKDEGWEGPTVRNAVRKRITEDNELIDSLLKGLKNRDNTSNEFGKLTAKATSVVVIELKQSYISKDSNELFLLRSQSTFIDLPGSETLVEDPETVRIKQGSTLNKVIIAVTQLLKDLANRGSDQVLYDTSTVTRLCKETFGSNSFNVGIFCLQHGDPKGSSLTLKTLKDAKRVISYPVVNTDKFMALMRQYRSEASASKGTVAKKDTALAQGDLSSMQEILDLKRQVNEQTKLIADMDDEIQDLKSKLGMLRGKFQEVVRQKAELQEELIKSEEERLIAAKALIEVEMENARLIKIIQEEQYNANNKALSGDGLAKNVKDGSAQDIIRELQDRLKEALEESKDLDMEFMSLRKNYHEKLNELEQSRLMQENYQLELINIVNENKAMHEEVNQMYLKSGSSSEENKLLVQRIDKLQNDLRDKDEALVFAKAEIERLKVEIMRFDILNKQGRLDVDKKHLQLDKSGFQQPPILSNPDDEANKNERMVWESQKMELTHKVKSLQRRVNDDNERIKELERQINELIGENNKMQLQLDEMRAIYRNKLIQIHKLDPRDELFQTYAQKERELSEVVESLRRKNKQLNIELRSIRSYSRNIRYLAEDWAPAGLTLPDILQRDYPLLNEEEMMTQLQKDQEQEINRLRNRNHTIESELSILKERNKNDNMNDTSKKLINEIQLLKSSQVLDSKPSTGYQKERNNLQEENRKLVQLLKDTNKWDAFVLQKENDRLLQMLKDYEMIGPQSGQSKNVQSKITFYEQLTRQLEKEKTELLVKTTVAEEQLVQLQISLTKMTTDYQRQINQLKKQLKQL